MNIIYVVSVQIYTKLQELDDLNINKTAGFGGGAKVIQKNLETPLKQKNERILLNLIC